MQTYRELVYLCLDELKGMSNDFTYTEEHLMFLLSKYRAFLLKQRYSDIKKQIPLSNYQTIKVDIENYAVIGSPFIEKQSILNIPDIMLIGNPRVFTSKYYLGDIALISRDRFRYASPNKYLKNIIYASLTPDGKLNLKSENEDLRATTEVRFTAIFQDSTSVLDILDGEKQYDTIDCIFPIEDSLIAPLIEMVVKELSNSVYRPDDTVNNDADDLAKVQTK